MAWALRLVLLLPEHECVGPGEDRDVSYYVKDFRFRGDLGPPMTITGLPEKEVSADDVCQDDDYETDDGSDVYTEDEPNEEDPYED